MNKNSNCDAWRSIVLVSALLYTTSLPVARHLSILRFYYTMISIKLRRNARLRIHTNDSLREQLLEKRVYIQAIRRCDIVGVNVAEPKDSTPDNTEISSHQDRMSIPADDADTTSITSPEDVSNGSDPHQSYETLPKYSPSENLTAPVDTHHPREGAHAPDSSSPHVVSDSSSDYSLDDNSDNDDGEDDEGDIDDSTILPEHSFSRERAPSPEYFSPSASRALAPSPEPSPPTSSDVLPLGPYPGRPILPGHPSFRHFPPPPPPVEQRFTSLELPFVRILNYSALPSPLKQEFTQDLLVSKTHLEENENAKQSTDITTVTSCPGALGGVKATFKTVTRLNKPSLQKHEKHPGGMKGAPALRLSESSMQASSSDSGSGLTSSVGVPWHAVASTGGSSSQSHASAPHSEGFSGSISRKRAWPSDVDDDFAEHRSKKSRTEAVFVSDAMDRKGKKRALQEVEGCEDYDRRLEYLDDSCDGNAPTLSLAEPSRKRVKIDDAGRMKKGASDSGATISQVEA